MNLYYVIVRDIAKLVNGYEHCDYENLGKVFVHTLRK